jgi:carbon starvation protein
MNTMWIVVIAAIVIYVAYNFYAKRIDRDVIQADAKKATPAKMYMDGVDFMPTTATFYGYHFKSIAALDPRWPITGPTRVAPSLLWLLIGVSFIGWVSDYSAIMVAVRNDGNSLSAISHKLIAPRTRSILFTFIFFYLMLVAGAFMGIMAALMAARPDVPLGLIALGVMGFLAGQMLYKWKMDLIVVTVIGRHPVGHDRGSICAVNAEETGLHQGPIAGLCWLQHAKHRNGRRAVMSVTDPTNADPRVPAPAADGTRADTAVYTAATGEIKTMPAYLFWALFLLVFSYLAATLPIWKFAQPVNYTASGSR